MKHRLQSARAYTVSDKRLVYNSVIISKSCYKLIKRFLKISVSNLFLFIFKLKYAKNYKTSAKARKFLYQLRFFL